jgi:hypothetical protein
LRVNAPPLDFLAQGCLLPEGFRVAVGLLGALALMFHLLIFVPSFPSFTALSLFLAASPLLLSFSHFFLSFLGAIDKHKNIVTRGLRRVDLIPEKKSLTRYFFSPFVLG